MQEKFMWRALELAKKGLGFTSPNPLVGAVIVKGGEIVGEGYHRKAGTDHAEIVAIKQVMKKSGIKSVDLDPALFHNATLYVTLEPCSHIGKTPSCARAIVAAGFKKVCIGMKDPFDLVNGRGIKFLRDHGVELELCKPGSRLYGAIGLINQQFIKSSTISLPYVVLKAGMSLDGKIATATGESKWITGDLALRDARLERSACDAVLVGAGTVLADDPELAPYGRFSSKKLLRVIIDPALTLPFDLKVFRDENVFVAYCSGLASSKNLKRYDSAGINCKAFGSNRISISRLLGFLSKKSIQSVFVEGGSSVHGSFCDEALAGKKVVDKVIFYVAAKIIGGKDSLAVIGGDGALSLVKSLRLTDLEFEKVGMDLKLSALVNRY
ncbi:bifunctional diaminohydroxyphosphoribosylaminopyrimidine deaminase/5-amino-6-(5-phosphoribosylamino)uracil reductase RibD [Candidatus Peregrinibacteria bacterium]|nr:bifunctional diaminohydroxyphosphoribosylaminopyrimidine deaminase/5-amino-6-(5-phosphoribosylamino)uracil reductase RibD [Candidatus Peregrinibacteria bacterium]